VILAVRLMSRTEMQKRNQSLDILRGVAVLMVLAFHFGLRAHVGWGRAGWAGVDLFFVLSGFLISGLLFRDYRETGQIHFARFFWRRGFKIWPAFFCYMTLIALLILLIPIPEMWPGFRAAATFTASYFRIDNYAFVHLWSLSVEEHFYLLLPLILLLLAKFRKSFDAIPVVFAAVATISLASRFAVPNGDTAMASHMRMDSLFAGVLLRYLHDFKPSWFQPLTKNWALAAAALFCSPLVLMTHTSRAMQTVGLSSLYIGFSFLIAWASVRSHPGILAKLMAGVGVSSYSIYLWHVITLSFFEHSHSGLVAVSYFAAAIGTGMLASYLFESPFLVLREKLIPNLAGKPNKEAPPKTDVVREVVVDVAAR